jgi:putative transposase
MKRGVPTQRQGKVNDVTASAAASGLPTEETDSTVARIQALIPLGLHAVGEAVEAEAVAFASARYRRTDGRPGGVRWGQQPSSGYLADPKLPIPIPRVRDRGANQTIPLTTYERLQVQRAANAGLSRNGLVGLTCRQNEAGAETVLVAFGLSASSVSRRVIRASARHLRTLCERRLDRDEFVAVGLDGKTFAQEAMVIALRITLQGQQEILGFVRRPPRTSRFVRHSWGRW